MAPYRRQAIIWAKADPIHCGGDELVYATKWTLNLWFVYRQVNFKAQRYQVSAQTWCHNETFF